MKKTEYEELANYRITRNSDNWNYIDVWMHKKCGLTSDDKHTPISTNY